MEKDRAMTETRLMLMRGANPLRLGLTAMEAGEIVANGSVRPETKAWADRMRTTYPSYFAENTNGLG